MNDLKELYRDSVNSIVDISTSPETDIKILMEKFLGIKYIDVIIGDKKISKENLKDYKNALNKRINGEVLQYITCEEIFMGLCFYVDENVLVPRDETEILVNKALDGINKSGAKKILEVGVGSGAISVSLAKYSDIDKVYALDISKNAIDVAKRNAKDIGVFDKIEFIESDLFENVSDDLLHSLDMIVSNPPYIPLNEMKQLHADVKKEPEIALYGGVDGLDYYRKITKSAFRYLKNGGTLIYEIGYNQSNDIYDILKSEGFKQLELIKDFNNYDRVVIAHKVL